MGKLVKYLSKNIRNKYECKIIIADNASTDDTGKIGRSLARRYKNVRYIFIPYKGRGNALKQVWTKNKADISAYCDVDLATNLGSLETLFKCIAEGNDIVIGNRYLHDSRSQRNLDRVILLQGL